QLAPPRAQQLAPPVQQLAPPIQQLAPPPIQHVALPPVQPVAPPQQVQHLSSPPPEGMDVPGYRDYPMQLAAPPPEGTDVPGYRDYPMQLTAPPPVQQLASPPPKGMDTDQSMQGIETDLDADDDDDDEEEDEDDDDGPDPKEGPGGKNGRIAGVYKYQEKGTKTQLKSFRRNTERPARLLRGRPQSKGTNLKFRAVVQKAEFMSDSIDCWIICAALPKNSMGDLRLYENEDMAIDAPGVKERVRKLLFDALQAKRIQRLAEMKKESDENKSKAQRAEDKARKDRKRLEKYKARLAKVTSEKERLEANKVRDAKKKDKKKKSKKDKAKRKREGDEAMEVDA
ncbi:hypothetical protein AURDEDRAFT_178739, partial [Auricularia subglabra TFB-10046 SS5]